MRRTLSIVALLTGTLSAVLATSSASARRVSPGNDVSWGKAGVSMEDYWVDSSQCGHRAAGIDLTGTALPMRWCSRHGGWITGAISTVSSALRIAAPELQWDRAAKIIQVELEKCLTEHGYVKFQLTKDQAHQLKMLKAGTLERRKYLYSLASDPAVLEAQALKA